MEQLSGIGTAIQQIIGPTFQAYAPLLQKQANEIRSTTCSTYAYGSHPRQNLDVYTPPVDADPATKNANSVLVFLYGGGLVRGDKSNKEFLNGLIYANLGHYFAKNLGIEVAVVDYRLISHGAEFPSGGEDVALAIEWLKRRAATHSSQPLDIYLMGNSAGGIHISTYLLAPDFAASRQQILPGAQGPAVLRAAILIAVPFHFGHADPGRTETLETYYGSSIKERSPLGLLVASKQCNAVDELRHIPVLVLKGTLDPKDEILDPIDDFVNEWRGADAVASNLTVYTMNGHNHISPVLAVGTGVPNEEAWAKEVVDFIVASSRK